MSRAKSVSMMYGADGRLRTMQYNRQAVKMSKRYLKAFDKDLKKCDDQFMLYANLDVTEAKINSRNTKYIYKKLGIMDKYADYIPVEDMAAHVGDDMTAIAGNKAAARLSGFKTRVAEIFQPFVERQAEKHPRLQKLSDNITKAANDGRMPLTADSAATMKIAFDKRYYEDMRQPGADKDALRERYNMAVGNLLQMAKHDGVRYEDMSKKLGEKILQRTKYDVSFTDMYAGISTGEIRLAPEQPARNGYGDIVKLNGNVVYHQPDGFVDKNGRTLDPLSFTPREPQSIESIMQDYMTQMNTFMGQCYNEADIKRMLCSDSYRNIERTARAFAEADNIDDAEKFKYEFKRANMICTQKWGMDHNIKHPYADIVIPLPYDRVVKDNNVAEGYSTSDYYDIDSVHDEAVEDCYHMSDSELRLSYARDYEKDASDLGKMTERLNALEAENKALREQLRGSDVKVVDAVYRELPDLSHETDSVKNNEADTGLKKPEDVIRKINDSYYRDDFAPMVQMCTAGIEALRAKLESNNFKLLDKQPIEPLLEMQEDIKDTEINDDSSDEPINEDDLDVAFWEQEKASGDFLVESDDEPVRATSDEQENDNSLSKFDNSADIFDGFDDNFDNDFFDY